MLDNNLRIQYLQAMGLEVWVPRNSSVSAPNINDRIEESRPSVTSDLLPPSNSWNDLNQTIAHCQRCELAQYSTSPVAEILSQTAHWLVITAPYHADPSSVMESDALLHAMFRALGLNNEDVVRTSALKCPLPKERAPHRNELAECRLFLEQHIELLQPKIILLMGSLAAQSILQTDTPLEQLRGIIHKVSAISTVVTYDPYFLLHALLEKRFAWLDLQLAMTAYREVNRL